MFRVIMQSKSESSVFSDSSQLSSSNTGSITGQNLTPSFLFGPRSRRRDLIMSFGKVCFVFLRKKNLKKIIS